MATLEKTMIVMTVAIFGFAVMSQVVQAMVPSKDYCCPLCVDVCFYTYEELYTHFTTQHPAEPIDIIWGD